MKQLLRLITGYGILFLPSAAQSALLRYALAGGFSFYRQRPCKDGCFLYLPWRLVRAFCDGAQAQGLPRPRLVAARGLLPQLFRYRRRFGLFFGGALFLFLLVLARQFLWYAEITTLGIGQEQARELLAQYGIAPGTPLCNIDPADLQNRIKLEHGDVRRININLCGTVAYVSLSMKERSRKADPLAGEITLFEATHDGFITSVSLADGTPACEVGQMVSAGDILAYGIEDDKKGNSRIRRVRGEICGQVLWQCTFDVPYVREEKLYSGCTEGGYALKIFKKQINLYRSSRFLGQKCDKITEESTPHLLFSRELPLTLVRERYLFYETQPVRLDARQARQTAEAELRRRMEKELSGAAVLTRDVALTEGEEALTVRCAVLCEMQIAAERKMTEQEIQEIIAANDRKKDSDGNS